MRKQQRLLVAIDELLPGKRRGEMGVHKRKDISARMPKKYSVPAVRVAETDFALHMRARNMC